MPINKIVSTADAALEGVTRGSVILVGGFGGAGSPAALLEALIRKSVYDLTIISNNAGVTGSAFGELISSGAVKRLICSFPRSAEPSPFPELYEKGEIELELVPQGTLSERIRAAGAGIGGFYTRTGVGTLLTADKECREIGGIEYVLEQPLRADVALIAGHLGDRWGNLTYSRSARNLGPTMAMAAKLTVAQVDRIVPLGGIDPEHVITPGIFVDRVVEISQ